MCFSVPINRMGFSKTVLKRHANPNKPQASNPFMCCLPTLHLARSHFLPCTYTHWVFIVIVIQSIHEVPWPIYCYIGPSEAVTVGHNFSVQFFLSVPPKVCLTLFLGYFLFVRLYCTLDVRKDIYLVPVWYVLRTVGYSIVLFTDRELWSSSGMYRCCCVRLLPPTVQQCTRYVSR